MLTMQQSLCIFKSRTVEALSLTCYVTSTLTHDSMLFSQLSESWASASALGSNLPQTGGAAGGELVTIVGNGFDTTGTMQYRCDFTIDCCVPADSPTCDLSTCPTRSESESVYALSPTALQCYTPAWGARYAFTGSQNAAQLYTRLSIVNLYTVETVRLSGSVATEKLAFEERWESVAPKKVPISGAQITVLGAGFDTACATSLRGCYKCAFSAPAATTMYGGVTPCADSTCTGALATPTSTLEVTCQLADWGILNSGGMITVTLLHGDDEVVKHITAATPPSGSASAKQFLTVEAWSAFTTANPLYMTSATSVTITGSGFDPAGTYKCIGSRTVTPSVPCSADADCQSNPDPACNSIMVCVSAFCARKLVSPAIAPTTKASITCSIPAPVWGGCFMAASVSLSLEKLDGLVYTPVLYSGTTNTLSYAETWASMSINSGSKYGGDLLILGGRGFDTTAAYKCKFSLSGVDLEVSVFLTTAKELRCITPNWAELSGLDGSGGASVVSVYKGAVLVVGTAPAATFTFTVSRAKHAMTVCFTFFLPKALMFYSMRTVVCLEEKSIFSTQVEHLFFHCSH